MTLVVGLNFSHRLCLAGDTRVTRTKNTGEVLYIDNVSKVTPLWGRQVTNQVFYNRDFLALAVAGDVTFADFLQKRLQRELASKRLSSDIRKLDTEILFLIKELTDEWLVTNDFANAGLIISGMTMRRRKRITRQQVDDLVERFNRGIERDRPRMENFLNEDFPNNLTFQEIDKKMRDANGKGVREMLEESSKPTLPEWIVTALGQDDLELDLPDSLIVGVDVRPGHSVLKKETAEWGEMLAYGSSLTKADLPYDLLARLELSHIKDSEESRDMLESAIISASILDLAKERKIEGIGGSPIILWTNSSGVMLLRANGLQIGADGRLFFELAGKKVPIVMFNKLAESKDVADVLEM